MNSSRLVVAVTLAALSVVVGLVVVWVSQDDASHARREARASGSSDKRSDIPKFAEKPIVRLSGNPDGFVTASACRECHPRNHSTWHDSYHRTMTQAVTPETVIGDFDGAAVTVAGKSYKMILREGKCWVSMDDPDALPGRRERIERLVSVSTGSHHMQVYWYAVGQSDTLGQLPLAYLKETQQWVPRDAVFLKSHERASGTETGRWNTTCILCHTTGPRKWQDLTSSWDSSPVELGISCEACHGPGEEHIALQERLAASDNNAAGDLDRDPIVNPARLPHRLQSQVCGQCHSIKTVPDHLAGADYYRAGDDLSASTVLVRVNEKTWDMFEQKREQIDKGTGSPGLTREAIDKLENTLLNSFWRDGMVRVSGREYNGLVESSCHQRGQLSCLSCHSLHQAEDDLRDAKEWADDQLAAGMRGDQGCTQCHEPDQYGEQHTHHLPSSPGAQCYNCHMPYTTYGLLKAIRSHTISSPDIAADLKAERPNACNLCHLDKTLAWSADWTQQWYGSPRPELDDEQSGVAASLLWLLKGDAGERALSAWSMGWEPARQASGTDWQAPFLAHLLEDPYPAVRLIASRSLRVGEAFTDLEYDFVGEAAELAAVKQRVLQAWSRGSSMGSQILVNDEGLQQEAVNELIRQRNDRIVDLAE